MSKMREFVEKVSKETGLSPLAVLKLVVEAISEGRASQDGVKIIFDESNGLIKAVDEKGRVMAVFYPKG